MDRRGRMQRKDVDDRVILAGIAVACALRTRVSPLSHGQPWECCSRWDLDFVLSGVPERVGVGPYDGYASWLPYKLLMAKLEHMERRGLIDGCTCGCRGDFTVLDKGRATAPDWMPVVAKLLE
jgi:hypothetical protein